VKTKIVALHGFLGRGNDWQAVREASGGGFDWICPDLFAPGTASFEPPAVDGPCWLAGYSFGARLALRWLQQAPDRWRGALLLSVNPGNFQSDQDRAARRISDAAWAEAFRDDPWDDLLRRWNAQPVLASSPAPRREEKDFDRGKLARALVEYSVADEFTDPLRLPPRLTWLAGARDEKFADLQKAMRDAGFPGTFEVVEGAGHRLLPESPSAVAAALGNLVA
jgi:2-succinyl-6-hydroxy-2,4-cyclohexadiene-1-carboxylate synthase